MQITDLARRVLQLIFTLSSSGAALTRPRLERRLRVSAAALNQAIVELAGLGLLQTQRLRLTFPGLAVAVASRSRSSASPQTLAAKAPPATPSRSPIALFSQREAPRAVA